MSGSRRTPSWRAKPTMKSKSAAAAENPASDTYSFKSRSLPASCAHIPQLISAPGCNHVSMTLGYEFGGPQSSFEAWKRKHEDFQAMPVEHRWQKWLSPRVPTSSLLSSMGWRRFPPQVSL